MNNSFTLTQAKHLAKRLIAEVPQDNTARINHAYQLLFSRPATKAEHLIAQAIIASTNKQTAEAAWIDLAHVLLCCNEFVYLD